MTAKARAEEDKFYLNIVLINAKELVSAKVQEKVGKGFLGRAAAKVVTGSIDNNAKIMKKMSPALETKIPEAIKEIGIDMSAKTIYKNGPLFVVEFTINGVDTLKLIKHGKGEEGTQHFSKLFDAMTTSFIGNADKIFGIEGKVRSKAKINLMAELSKKIPAKVADMGLKIECTSIKPKDQGIWLLNHFDRDEKDEDEELFEGIEIVEETDGCNLFRGVKRTTMCMC